MFFFGGWIQILKVNRGLFLNFYLYYTYQTVGSLAPEEVVTMALKTLVDKLAYVQMQIQEEVETKEQDNMNAWNF